jgi:Fe-S-cluster containining protein
MCAHRDVASRPPLPVPPLARDLQREIVRRLEHLAALELPSCRDPRFNGLWQEVLSLADRYTAAISGNAGLSVTCSAGCRSCCFHWVEDVNSFEAELLADHLRETAPDRIDRILDQCRRDRMTLESLDAIVAAKLSTLSAVAAQEVDATDLLLASFYRLRIPCPVLDRESGRCMGYDRRPLTCRLYVSFSDPVRCVPGRPDDGGNSTYLFDLEEEADGIIDSLHFRFLRFEGDAGLRSLLWNYLSINSP